MSDRDVLDAFRDELDDIEKQILPFNTEDELAAALKEQWDRFIEEDFQKISDLITSQLWFQTPAQVTSQMAAQVE